MRELTALTLVLAGCHLIGGAGDLDFRDGPATGGGSAQGGSGGAGGEGGGASCEASCTGVCEACDVPGLEGTCTPRPIGDECADGLCDGTGVCATGTPMWARLFGDGLDSAAEDVAVMGDDVMMVGHYDTDGGTGFSLDDEPMNPGSATTGEDLFAAKLRRSDGVATWAVSLSDNQAQRLSAVAFDPRGDIVVAGIFAGQVAHTGWPTLNSGVTKILVGKLASTGAGAWNYTTPSVTTAIAELTRIAMAADGSIAVAGGMRPEDLYGSITLGNGQTLDCTYVSDTGIVIVLEPDPVSGQTGTARWGLAINMGDGSDSFLTDVAFDAAGDLWTTGSYFGQDMTFGRLPMASAPRGFAAKLSASDGTALEVRTLGSALSDNVRPTAIGAVPDGVVVAGTFTQTLDLTGGHTATAVDGDADIFVAGLALDGTTRWLRHVASIGATTVRDIAVDSAGHVAVAGSFSNGLDFGDGAVLSAGGTPGAFVFKLDGEGTYLWSQRPGGAGGAMAAGIAFDADRQLLLAGTATGDAPPSTDTYVAGDDILLMMLAP